MRTLITRIVPVLALCFLAINFAIYYQIGVTASEAPELTSVTDKNGDANDAFNALVHDKFVAGMSAPALTAYLAGIGFASERWDPLPGQTSIAYRDQSNWAAVQCFAIRWSVDGAGKLAAINGSYRRERCPQTRGNS